MSEVAQKSIKASVKDYEILRSPVITEKASAASGALVTVAFKVDPRSTKTEIRAAVQRVFDVKVESVRTLTFIGKVKRTARSSGRRAGYKKAYVTLAEGQKINIVEGL